MGNYNSSYSSIDDLIDCTLGKFASITSVTSDYFKLLADTLQDIQEQKEENKFEEEANKYFS